MKAPNNYDHYYLDPNRTKDPKESFKFIASEILPYLKALNQPSIGDIGCATGDLMYYIKSLFPEASYTGLDVDKALLERAAKELPFADFALIDITEKSSLPNKKFDALMMNGVHGYYESMDVWVPNFVSMIKPGGRGYLFSTFNPEDVDVIIHLRNPTKTKDYMTFGCMFSFHTVREEFKKVNMSVKFIPFQIGMDVIKNAEDPIRSWTFKDDKGVRITKNGAQIIQNYYLVEITHNDN